VNPLSNFVPLPPPTPWSFPTIFSLWLASTNAININIIVKSMYICTMLQWKS